jgi:hypothetical protein
MGQIGNVAFYLTGWALATYWLGNQTAAQRQLGEALQLTIKIGNIRPAVHGILVAALIRADQGELRQAVELYALASSFPFAGNSRWCHDVAGWYLASVAASMPPDASAVAYAHGQTRDIWVTVQETLSWLDSSQAGEPTGP